MAIQSVQSNESEAIDLLVFGPHPDDLEIGLGGTIAHHTAAGHRVGLCDLTEGELSSNGTPEQRRAEALEAARVLGAAWRENLGWPDGGIDGPSGHDPSGGRLDPPLTCRARSRFPTGTIAIPITSRPARCCGSPHSAAASAATDPTSRRGGPSGSATTSSTTAPRRRLSSMSRRSIDASATRSTAIAASSHPRTKRGRHAADRAHVPAADRKPRRAVRRAGRRRVRRRRRRPRAGRTIRHPEAHAMNIGMVCYASVGGSGVVATELAHALADRGHHVHLHQQRAAVPLASRRARSVVRTQSPCPRIRCFASRSTCWRWPTPSHASPRSSSSTSFTRTTQCRTRPPRISPTRCSRRHMP